MSTPRPPRLLRKGLTLFRGRLSTCLSKPSTTKASRLFENGNLLLRPPLPLTSCLRPGLLCPNLASLLLYTKTRAGAFPRFGAPALFHPVFLGCVAASYALWTLRSTPALTNTLRHTVTSFAGGQVRFRDTLMADVLTSLVKVLTDIALSACFLLPGLVRSSRACGKLSSACALCADPRKPFRSVVAPCLAAAPLAPLHAHTAPLRLC